MSHLSATISVHGIYWRTLEWLVTHKKIFFEGFPHQYKTFLALQHVPLNSRVSGYSDLKLTNLSLFAGFRYILRIFNAKFINFKSKEPETRAFKGTCYKQKKVLYWWGKPYQKIQFLSEQSSNISLAQNQPIDQPITLGTSRRRALQTLYIDEINHLYIMSKIVVFSYSIPPTKMKQ